VRIIGATSHVTSTSLLSRDQKATPAWWRGGVVIIPGGVKPWRQISPCSYYKFCSQKLQCQDDD